VRSRPRLAMANSRQTLFGFDDYSPDQIAARVREFAVTKARLPLLTLGMLGMLAGAFVGFCARMCSASTCAMSWYATPSGMPAGSLGKD